MRSYRSSAFRFTLVFGLFPIIATTGLLWLANWEHGISLIPSDSFFYLRSAINFSAGQGLGVFRYLPETDQTVFVPLTHYPPLLSLLYAAGYAIGFSHIPSLISLIGWVALLLGIGLLVYQARDRQAQNNTLFASGLAIWLAAITHGFYLSYRSAMSEMVFLPLLVWLMVVVYDLPAQQPGKLRWFRLIVVVILLALLMLTRYVGIVVLGAMLLWWCWWCWWEMGRGGGESKLRSMVRGISETVLLMSSALPVFAVLLWNRGRGGRTLGNHLAPSGSPLDGLIAMAKESSLIVFPASSDYRIQFFSEWGDMLVYPVIVVCGGVLLWYAHRARQPGGIPPRTPIPVFLFAYVLLYTLVQPFLAFWPIDIRDMTTILCLTIPWITILVIRAPLPSRVAISMLVLWVTLNGALAIGPTLVQTNRYGLPDWVQRYPPHFASIANRSLPPKSPVFSAGLLRWLIVRPPTTHDLERYHPDLLAWLEQVERRETKPNDDAIILTNEPLFFASYAIGVVEHISNPYPDHNITTPQGWLEGGRCVGNRPMVLVLFDWHGVSSAALAQQIEEKCPGIPKQLFAHSVGYELP